MMITMVFIGSKNGMTVVFGSPKKKINNTIRKIEKGQGNQKHVVLLTAALDEHPQFIEETLYQLIDIVQTNTTCNIDYALDFSKVFKDSPLPIFYWGNIKTSGIFTGSKNAFGSPIGPQANKQIDYFSSIHYFALPCTRDFVLLGYIGVEKMRHNKPVGIRYYYLPQVGAEEVLLNYSASVPSTLLVNEKDAGGGLGFDWYFKQGMGLYVKFH